MSGKKKTVLTADVTRTAVVVDVLRGELISQIVDFRVILRRSLEPGTGTSIRPPGNPDSGGGGGVRIWETDCGH